MKPFVLFLAFFLSSCSIINEDLTDAKALVSAKHYSEAIELLDTYKSFYSKRYNSKVHVEYGMTILSDLDIDQQERYKASKEIFEKALKLDAKNQRARVYYLTVLKSIVPEKEESEDA